MGVRNIHLLKPGNDADPDSGFVVTTPNGNGEFTISGGSVTTVGSTRFSINNEFVTPHGDGSYSVTSA